MKRVIQKDENGCGVACVATLACVSYDDARKKMFKRKGGLTDTLKIQRALKKFKLKAPRRLIRLSKDKSYKELKCDAVLKLKSSRSPFHRRGGWHWVVWDATARKVRDPQEPPYIIDGKIVRIMSYLPVSRMRENS